MDEEDESWQVGHAIPEVAVIVKKKGREKDDGTYSIREHHRIVREAVFNMQMMLTMLTSIRYVLC